jgi:hypothetical protein
MKKIIKLTESDIMKIVERVINEQSRKKIKVMPTYSCLPNKKGMSEFINFVIAEKNKLKSDLNVNDEVLLFLTKVAVGIMEWQSEGGTADRLYDMDKFNLYSPEDIYNTLNKIGKFFGIDDKFGEGKKYTSPPLEKYKEVAPYDVYSKINKVGKSLGIPSLAGKTTEFASTKLKKDEPSFGPAEFMPSKYSKTGVEGKYGYGLESIIGSGLAVMIRILESYRIAQKNGLSSGKSENPIAKLKGIPGWGNIKGTGNHLWDLAISTHTFPADKMLVKYCKTSRPDFAAPCNKVTYKPFTSTDSWKSFIANNDNSSFYKKNPQLTKFPGEIKVLTGQAIPNYYPYLSGSHGDYTGDINNSLNILDYVVSSVSKYSCVDKTFNEGFPMRDFPIRAL